MVTACSSDIPGGEGRSRAYATERRAGRGDRPPLPGERRGGCPGSALALTAGSAAAAAQRHPRLGQDPENEAVRPSGRASHGADALPGVVSLLQGSRLLRADGTAHQGAFIDGLSNAYLPV